MVVNKNGTVEQVTHYYPYGGVIGGISINQSMQRNKFEGKELDRTFGLDNYDIQARQYFAMMPSWDRIDPLAEKYYGISPYVYCGGDPVNYGDYNGMDIWTVDETGVVRNREKNEKIDQLLVIHESGDITKSKEFNKGTIIYETHNKSGKNANLKISDSEAAANLSEFLLTNTSVEWSKIVVNEPGRNDISYLTTSNSVGRDESRGDLLLSLGDNTEIVKASHNHPSGSPIPSGSHDTDKGKKGTYGDIKEAIELNQKGKFPEFFIESIVPGTSIIQTTKYDSTGNYKIINFRVSRYPINKIVKGVQYAY